MKFTVVYRETYGKCVEVEAASEEEAIQKFNKMAEDDPRFFEDVEMCDSSVVARLGSIWQ